MMIAILTNVHKHCHHDTSSIGYLTAKTTSLWWITFTIQIYYSNMPISEEEVVSVSGIISILLCVTPNLSPIRAVPVTLSYTVCCI